MIEEFKIPLVRGYKVDQYENGIHLKNDYLLVSPLTVKYHFNQEVSHLFQKEPGLIGMLDSCNFWLSVTTVEHYRNKYLSIGHPISTRYRYPEWIGRMVLGRTEEDIHNTIKSVINTLDSIKTANNITDLFLRIQTIFPHYAVKEFPNDARKYMYTYCNHPLKKKALTLSFQVNDIIIQTSNNGEKYGLAQCLASFIAPSGELVNLTFIVNIFTPKYIYYFQSNHNDLFPPHVIVEQLDSNQIEKYLLYTFGYIQASTKQELILKLSIFTNSFLPKKLITQELYHDLEYQLKSVYLDYRN